MNSKALILLVTTLTFLSFPSISKAETARKLTVSSPESTAVVEDKGNQSAEKPPESTAVVEDKTEQAAETNSQPETVDRNSTQNEEPAATKEQPSSSGKRVYNCGK